MMVPANYDEGITKFDLAFTPSAPLPAGRLRAAIVWRNILWRLGLVGQDPTRYGGVGYGNVSQRLGKAREPCFAITGTQTGALPGIGADHFGIVTACDLRTNRVHAEGPIAPSSESLTHAMLYRIDASVRYVFHVHSPEIWRARTALKLPATATAIPYGTAAMGAEVRRLKCSGAFVRRRIVVMTGHEDGVIAFGRSADQAGTVLLRTLVKAMSI